MPVPAWLDPQNWTWKVAVVAVGLAVVVLIVFGVFEADDGGITDEQYRDWRAECELRATAAVEGSVYTVGGRHWADLVNDCITDKAVDQP